ncbi:MAG: hypothetical protein QW487_04145 [Candidatus Bathyarchaeia archaeon]
MLKRRRENDEFYNFLSSSNFLAASFMKKLSIHVILFDLAKDLAFSSSFGTTIRTSKDLTSKNLLVFH